MWIAINCLGLSFVLLVDVEDEDRGMNSSWGRSGARVSRSDVEDVARDLKICFMSMLKIYYGT